MCTLALVQTRLILPSWLGVGEALNKAVEAGHAEELRKMYQDWPFFQVRRMVHGCMTHGP